MTFDGSLFAGLCVGAAQASVKVKTMGKSRKGLSPPWAVHAGGERKAPLHL